MENRKDLTEKLETSLQLLDKVVLLIGLKKKLLKVIIASNELSKENNVKVDITDEELETLNGSLDDLSEKSIHLREKYGKTINSKSQKVVLKSLNSVYKIFDDVKKNFDAVDELQLKQITIH